MGDIIWYLSFSVWLTSFSMTISRSSMLLQMTLFHSFNGWVIVLCICVPHLLYPFICQWTFNLLPCSGYCNSAAVNIEVHVSFWIVSFLRVRASRQITGSYGSSLFSFLRNLHNALYRGWFNLHFHQPWKKIPLFHILSIIYFCRCLDDGHSDQCKVIPHCSFDLYISNN